MDLVLFEAATGLDLAAVSGFYTPTLIVSIVSIKLKSSCNSPFSYKHVLNINVHI